MANYIGEFDCKLDSKGRLFLPAKLRSQIPNKSAAAMVVNRGFEKCLVLYTKADWEAETAKLNILNEFNREARKFIRVFNNGANMVQIDNAGRVLLPKKLMDYAGLSGEAVVSAYGSKIEIWDKKTFVSELEINADDFALAAEKMLGAHHNKGNDNDE